jgi:drug/metabolite transporter (DMT)-like permease
MTGTFARQPSAEPERPAGGRAQPGFGLYALVLFMIAGWSGNYLAGKIGLRVFPPVLLYGLRVSMAGVLMLPIYAWDRRRRPAASWTAQDIFLLVVLGVFGVSLNQFLFVVGLSRTSVAHASIFANTTPILILALAALWGLERLTGWKLVGVMMALIGVLLLRLLDNGPRTDATLAGDTITFCAALAFSIFTVLGKAHVNRYGTIAVNTVAYVGGALAMAPVTLWQSAGFPFQTVPLSAWAAVLYMALMPSVICYLIYYYALAHMDASRLAAFSYLQPLLAIILGIVFLHEHISLVLIASGIIILGGVYITERAR